jgi:tetratricopeptide (TPR) repeat protein
MKIIKLFVPLILLATFDLIAQPGSKTEAEVQLEGKMIDASWAFVAGQYEKAEKQYIEIVDKAPKNAAAHYELARTYCAKKQFDKAMQSAKMAADLDKKNSWYKQLLGEIFQSSGKFKDAAAIYEELTKLEPRNELYYYEWAECLAQNGEKEKAIKAFDLLEKRTGFNEDLHRQKHILYLELGDNKKAEKEIQKMIDHDPTNLDFYYLLASYFKQTGDKEKEKAVYHRVMSIAPNDTKANVALAAMSKSQNSDTDYLSSLKTLFQNKDIALDAKIKELIPYTIKVAEKGDVNLANTAIELVKIVDQAHPNEAKVSSIYGDLLYHSNRSMEALEQYQKTIKLNGTVFTVWEQVVDIQSTTQDFAGLLKSAEAALDYFPNQAAVYLYQGRANYGLQKYSDAVASYDQTIIMSGKNNRLKIDALTGLAKAQLKLQKVEAAKANLLKAQPLGAENSPEWLETFGDVAALNNDINNALLHWQKAKEKGSKSLSLEKKIAEKRYID